MSICGLLVCWSLRSSGCSTECRRKLQTEGAARVLPRFILVFCAYRALLHTQEYTVRHVMDALRSAIHSVPEGDGDTDNVANSPSSVRSTVLEQNKEEEEEEEKQDVEADGPGTDCAAEGVFCVQHIESACASCT